jgi:lipopolysaccharide/colanic/teichoic acid biosynthesis glycosyltransferase
MGLGGRPFQMLKFRTMIQNAERVGGTSTSVDDPRITKIGKLLRKYKLDELPQLLNVLKGEMSMVGPRPEVPGYVQLYSEEERLILTVPPGLTDWATLWNVDEGNVLAGSSDPDKMYLESIRPIKIRLQLEYVRNRSLWTDVKILVQTMLVILCGIKPRVMMTVTGQG